MFLNSLKENAINSILLLFKNYSFHRQQDTLLLLPAALFSFLLYLPIKKHHPFIGQLFINVAHSKHITSNNKMLYIHAVTLTT